MLTDTLLMHSMAQILNILTANVNALLGEGS